MSADRLHVLGIQYFGDGEFSKAIESLRNATDPNPDFHLNWYWLGRGYLEGKEFSQAVDAFRRALEIKPQSESAKTHLE